MKLKCLRYVAVVAGAAFLAIFFYPFGGKLKRGPRDYAGILAGDRQLRVTTEYNSVGCHVEGDSLSGFHYELARAFAEEKGLQLLVMPEMSLERQIEGIKDGTYDLIAGSILVTAETRDSLLAFTLPVLHNKQVLVQRKREEGDSLFLRNQLELAGKTVYIPDGSAASYRIRNLGREIGDTIHIQTIERYGAEQLIDLVAHGEIDYVACEAGLAQACLADFPQLDAGLEISFNQFYAWGVSPHSPALLDSLNGWLESYMRTKAFRRLLRKYQLD